MSSRTSRSRIGALLVLCWWSMSSSAEAGEIFISSAEFPPTPSSDLSSRERVSIFFRETDWHDTCPPELHDVTLDGFEIVIRFQLDPTNGCIPVPAATTYFDSVQVGPLPIGTYDVIVEAPDFTTGQIEQTTAMLEIVAPVQCGLVHAPAATVLLPYFEIDLESPGGRSTLFSVGNVEGEPVLAHATLWTNWGNPAVSFDFFVPADGVVTFNLRQVLLGHLPETSPPPDPPVGRYESCTDPVTLPVVDEQELRAILTGQPHPLDGLCHSSAVEEGRLATGYVTVDVVRDCSGAALTTFYDPGYFVDGGHGLATNDNALVGDFFLIDPANDYAQGEVLVPLVADAARFGSLSFYRRSDNRMPLPVALRSRFLNGGAFTGATDLLVWMESNSKPIECDRNHINESYHVAADWRGERGESLAGERFAVIEHAFRVGVGSELLPVGLEFGTLDVSVWHALNYPGPPSIRLLQTWTMPIASADGRFSVGLAGVPIEDLCR